MRAMCPGINSEIRQTCQHLPKLGFLYFFCLSFTCTSHLALSANSHMKVLCLLVHLTNRASVGTELQKGKLREFHNTAVNYCVEKGESEREREVICVNRLYT
jgi:hypothetical protein